MLQKVVILGAFVVSLLAAAAPAQARGLKGQAAVGAFQVGWGEYGKQPKGPEKTLLFVFSHKDPSVASGVSEADWAQEAKRQMVDVATLKSVLGRDVYRPAQGGVAICTMGAVKKGLCGKKLGLSERARAEMAGAILAKDGRCAAQGFDAAYHRAMAQALGAVDNILVLRATCR